MRMCLFEVKAKICLVTKVLRHNVIKILGVIKSDFSGPVCKVIKSDFITQTLYLTLYHPERG